MGGMLDWARREVKIACERENPYRKGDEFDYGCACYESALKAFKSLCEDGHSGFSIKMTQAILNRLLDGQPLTPIEDTDDVWTLCTDFKDGSDVYQCNRMSSLFKMCILMELLNITTSIVYVALTLITLTARILSDWLRKSLTRCFLSQCHTCRESLSKYTARIF